MIEHVYVVSALELAVLAGIYDMEEIYGLDLDMAMEASDEEIILCMQRMCDKGMLYVDKDAFCISDAYISLLEKIGQAEQYLCIYPGAGELSPVLGYVDREVVLVKLSTVHEGVIRMTTIEKEQMFEYLEEQNYLPDTLATKSLMDEECFESSCLNAEQWIQSGEAQLVIEKLVCGNPSPVMQAAVREQDGRKECMAWKNGMLLKMTYAEETMKQLLEELMS